MSNLFEITGNDIAQLDDVQLRSLIGLLCEADYRSAGLPTKGITWGGHQDASDGGLDVVVRDEVSPPKNSFVPRKITGFQVKTADMPKSEIIKEMRPNSALREEIKGLIKVGGAYIIVSSSGSTSDPALKKRFEAMREAVADEKNNQNLHLDFLDRGRIATWVRSHPSLILWVRNKIGRALNGWRPYENWANAPGGIKEEFLLDGGLRLHDGTKLTEEGLSVEDGLRKLRSILSTPGTSVRLAGLSGVGKTRLAQALFDERIGEHALKRSQAFYTDIGDCPLPDPGTLADQLIMDKTRAILIVDNCPPDLHHRLTQNCSKRQSTVSLLTVEYDVRDDLPEETSIFRLEPASEEIMEKLVRKRFPHISQLDARTIASFSGGNARIAIALANTVQKGETLSGFRNERLFERFFWQRQKPNAKLRISAEACSLVYSFEGTDVESENSELQFLASLVNKSGTELYRDVTELKRRDLIQSRSVWRAVLPHAIANRLARDALESIPKDTLVQQFLSSGLDRLIKSFTRRLSYLHDCETAIEIAKDWLGQDGWIGKSIGNLNSLGMDVLENIAPISPEITLDAIERTANGLNGSLFTSRENSHFQEFVRLLRHLAYDPELFDESVELLCRFALSESKNENYNSTRDVLKSLFYMILSGTHATVSQRAKIIVQLVDSVDHDRQELGLLLLDAALETWHFSSSYEFEFGARPRDFGYHPKTREEITRWLEPFIDICTRLALSGKPISEKARRLLADKLRGLWTKGGMFDTLEKSARQIQKRLPWNEGWIAVRGIIRYDDKDFEVEVSKRLHGLEKLLRPIDLLDRARTFALSDQRGIFDLEDDFNDNEDVSTGLQRAEDTTHKIGIQVAQNTKVLNSILPDLVSSTNARVHIFGKGLADGSSNKKGLLSKLRTEFKNIPPEDRNISIIQGFLFGCAENDPSFYNSTLDDLICDDVLGEWFPILQTASTIDKRGIKRLNKALDLGKAPIQNFQYLAYGRRHETINDNELAGLLKKIISKNNGIDVGIEILQMRFHGRSKNSKKCSDSLIAVAQDLLSRYKFDKEQRRKRNRDLELGEIARICLNGPNGIHAATNICRNLLESIADSRIYAFDYPDLLKSLAMVQAIVFLDVFLGSNDIEDYQLGRIFSNDFEMRDNPLNQIPDDEILSWCENDPSSRYPPLALAIDAFEKSDETSKMEWKSITYAILERAPDLDVVLKRLADAIRPTSWSGSRADILQSRSVLFQELYDHDNTEVRTWARNQYTDLQEEIRKYREWEDQRHRERDERFE